MVNRAHKEGLERLDAVVSQFPNGKRLTLFDLKSYPPRFSEGWEVSTSLEGERVNLRILVTSDFPFKPPRIAIYPPRPVLSWPHLEEHGILCLLADSSPCSIEHVDAVVRLLLSEAVELVTACLRGDNFEEFEDEFQSYWVRLPSMATGYYSLCVLDENARWVYSCRLPDYRLVADTKEAVKKWVADLGFNLRKCSVEAIPLIHIGRPLRPSEYPKTFGDFFALLEKNDSALGTVGRYITSDSDKRKQFLLSFKSKGGIGLAGLLLPPPMVENISGRHTPMSGPRKKGFEQIWHGFRMSRGMCSDVYFRRYAALLLSGAKVTRVDTSWVHGRDHNPSTAILHTKSVVMIGAGSLGSGVLELLAKTGVGKITIVDPEILESENVCRHTLGIPSVARKKSTELKKMMVNRFPHLQFEEYPGGWEHMYARTPDKILSADLLISTVGGWKVESQLNALARSTAGFPAVLYGWLEPHAAAAHAVIFTDKGCLRCLTDHMGIPLTPVTIWPGGSTLLQIPMCGGMFQPYGAIELTHGQSLVADLAIDILMGKVPTSMHRAWVGQKRLLLADKGEWNPEWIKKHGELTDGGKICTLEVSTNTECPVCKELR